MAWLLSIGLTNALLATLLSLAAFALGRWLRRPALAHLLWIVVLAKLLTPPLLHVPLDRWIGRPSGWLADAAASFSAPQAGPVSAKPGSAFDDAGDGRASAEATGPSISLGPASERRRSRAIAAAPAGSPSLSPRPSEHSHGGASAAQATPLQRDAAIGGPSLVSFASLLRLGAAIWIAGSAAMLALLARRAWQFRTFVELAARPEPKWQARVDRLARRAGMASAPQVLLVENVVSPMLWGLGRRARLLFPAPLARRLDDEACDGLLLHELAHYARGDGWVRLLELSVQALYWWHPLVWLARGEIEAVEEECCDAWALEHQAGTRRQYAEALLATVDFLFEPAPAPLPPAACGLGEAPVLRRRLTQIMCGGAAVRTSLAWKAVVLVAAATVLPLSPVFFGAAANEAVARSVPSAPAPSRPRTAEPASLRRPQHSATSETADAPPREQARSRQPAAPRTLSALWATAISPNGKYRIEARTGRKTTLVHVESGWRLDLSAHRIACASFSPDSRTLATGHDDSVVRIWDCETGGMLSSLKGSEAPIVSVAYAPDGKRVAAGAADGGVRVWDPLAGDEIARLPGRSAPVSCLRFSPRGDRLAVALGRWSDDEIASLLIYSPGDRLMPEPQPLAEPVGALEWLSSDDSLVLAGWDGRARVWNLSAATPLGWFSIDKNLVSAAAWSPDCPLLSKWQAQQLGADRER